MLQLRNRGSVVATRLHALTCGYMGAQSPCCRSAASSKFFTGLATLGERDFGEGGRDLGVAVGGDVLIFKGGRDGGVAEAAHQFG